MPKNLADKYKSANSHPVEVDFDEIYKLGYEVIEAELTEDNEKGYVRHAHEKLAKVVFELQNKYLKKKKIEA